MAEQGSNLIKLFGDEEKVLREGSFSEEEVAAVVAALYRDAINEINEIDEMASRGNEKKALARIRKLVERNEGYLADDAGLLQLSLGFNFEVPVFMRMYQDELKGRQVVNLPVPLDLMYTLEGNILQSLGRDDEALEVLQKARRMNPLSQLPFAPMNQIYMEKRDEEAWLRNIREEASSIYRDGVCEAFGELAFYLGLHKEYEKAHACVKYVLDHTLQQDVDDRYSDLYEFLDSHLEVEPADFGAVCREYGLPEGPDPKVIAVLQDVAHSSRMEEDWETAQETYELLAELTESAEYQEEAEAMAAKLDD